MISAVFSPTDLRWITLLSGQVLPFWWLETHVASQPFLLPLLLSLVPPCSPCYLQSCARFVIVTIAIIIVAIVPINQDKKGKKQQKLVNRQTELLERAIWLDSKSEQGNTHNNQSDFRISLSRWSMHRDIKQGNEAALLPQKTVKKWKPPQQIIRGQSPKDQKTTEHKSHNRTNDNPINDYDNDNNIKWTHQYM